MQVVGMAVVALLVWVVTKDFVAVVFMAPFLWLAAMCFWFGIAVWRGRVQIAYLPVPSAEEAGSDDAPQK